MFSLFPLLLCSAGFLPQDGDPFFLVDNSANTFVRATVADVGGDELVTNLELSFWGDLAPADEPFHLFATRINELELVKLRESDGAIVQRISVSEGLRSIGYDPVADVLYALNQSGVTIDLLTVDRSSGATSLVGTTGIPGGALAAFSVCWDPVTGQLYTTDTDDDLYSINPDTGTASLIGSTGLSGAFSVGYSPRDRGLYMVDVDSDLLYRVDRATAAVTVVGGPLSVATFATGMAFTNEVCQTNLGFERAGPATLSICGEDLTEIGAQASLRIRNAPPVAVVVLMIGTESDPRPFLGELLVPASPILELVGFTTDVAGAFELPLTGLGGAGLSLVVQGYVRADTAIDLTNALQVTL